jgi:hypothetical protein
MLEPTDIIEMYLFNNYSATMMQHAPCPQCTNTESQAIIFTWWGGILGPKLMNHVKCNKCGTTYNGKTGKSNQQAISTYIAVSTIVGVGAVVGTFLFSSQIKNTYNKGNSLLLQENQQEQQK